MVSGTALSIAYGLDIKGIDDPHVKRAEVATGRVAGSGTYLVDVLPLLRYVPSWVPGATFQKEAELVRKLQEGCRELPYEETIRNIVRLVFRNISDEGSG